MRGTRSVMLAASPLLLASVWLGTPSAAPARAAAAPAAGWQRQMIDRFATRVHRTWHINISPGEYRIHLDRDGRSAVIFPRASAAPRHVRVHGLDMLAVSAVARPAVRMGARAADDEGVTWTDRHCYDRVYFPSPFDHTHTDAWVDACYQTGTLSYPGQVGVDYVLKEWQTCDNTGDDGYGLHLKACDIAFAPPPPNGGASMLDWTDWSPRSTITENPCGSATVGISYEGASASYTYNLCDTLNPVKGTAPLDFAANWSGHAQPGESREAADMIAVHDAEYSGINFQVLYGGMTLGV